MRAEPEMLCDKTNKQSVPEGLLKPFNRSVNLDLQQWLLGWADATIWNSTLRDI